MTDTALQPLALVTAACRRTWEERDELLRLGVVPVILTFLLNLWSLHLLADVFAAIQAGQTPDPAAIDAIISPSILIAAINWFVTSVFAVNWMRALMLGRGAVPGLGLSIRYRHVRFAMQTFAVQIVLGLGFLLAMLFLMLLLPLTALLFAGAVGFLVLYLACLLRLTPLWVGIAIDAPMPMKQAWGRTKGYGFQLVTVVAMIGLGLLCLQFLFNIFISVLGLMQLAPMAMLFISLVMQFAMTACICTALVLAYPRFVSETV